MGVKPKHHEVAPRSTYLGLPKDSGLNAFHWRAEIDGRESPKLTTTSMLKNESDITAFKLVGLISFSRNTQADADKTARLQGKQNNRRSK